MAQLQLSWLTVLTLTCISCSSNLYQVAEARYTGDQPTKADHIIDHGDLHLAYDFQAPGGMMRCKVINQSEQPVVLDLTQSSVVINGQARPYFEAEEFEFSSQSINYVRWYTRTKGSGTTQKRTGQLLIPPGAFFTVEEIALDYPFLLADQSAQFLGSKDSAAIANPKPFQFRHYLTYFSPQTPEQPIHLDDHFEVQSLYWLGSTLYQRREKRPMSFYHFSEEGASAGAVIFLGIFAGLGLIILATQTGS